MTYEKDSLLEYGVISQENNELWSLKGYYSSFALFFVVLFICTWKIMNIETLLEAAKYVESGGALASATAAEHSFTRGKYAHVVGLCNALREYE